MLTIRSIVKETVAVKFDAFLRQHKLFSLLSDPLNHSSLRAPSGLDMWCLLHVQGQVRGQNSPLDHFQSGFVLVQGQAAQDLVSLETGGRRDFEVTSLLVRICSCVTSVLLMLH